MKIDWLVILKCALADLEGLVQRFDVDEDDPARLTIREIKSVIKEIRGKKRGEDDDNQ